MVSEQDGVKVHRLVLLTGDRNMRVRARAMGIVTREATAFAKWVGSK